MNNGTSNIFDLGENDGQQEEQQQPLNDDGDEPRPVIYERDRLVMDAFIKQILFFRKKIELTDLYELLCVMYNVDKCHRIFKTPEELLEVIRERCATIIDVETNGQGQILLHWQDLDGNAAEPMKRQLVFGQHWQEHLLQRPGHGVNDELLFWIL